ncbi:response regulator [Algoriphagus sp. PAP.12]|uniref:response regulator n=1 Tax=Algoriphagus sp. PAP.12 TaxID=2996678 RepID=UPI00227C1312|nr:response regulator [Algoriphagus sp. PAP.12]
MDFSEIVLIDDDKLYTEVVRKRLCSFGFKNNVKIFFDGSRAIDHLKELSKRLFDQKDRLILLDLKMPVLDGWGFLDEFGKFDFQFKEHFKIVVITNFIGMEQRNRAIAYKEVIGYYHKPFNKTSIRGILEDLKVSFQEE